MSLFVPPSRVQSHLAAVAAVVAGREKPTVELRRLMKSLSKDTVPKAWRALCRQPISVRNAPTCPRGRWWFCWDPHVPPNSPRMCNVFVLLHSGWVADLTRRLNHLTARVHRGPATFQFGSAAQAVWLGGLMAPEGFVAGTRQVIAQRRGWSLEALKLHVMVEASEAGASAVDEDSFVMTGLMLYGAGWGDGTLTLSDQVVVALPPLRFRWVAITAAPSAAAGSTALITLPVYQDATRLDYLFSIDLPHAPATLPAAVLVQRGAALTVWSPARA